MRILINDKKENKERLVKIFKTGGYERNNLVFVHSEQTGKIKTLGYDHVDHATFLLHLALYYQ